MQQAKHFPSIWVTAFTLLAIVLHLYAATSLSYHRDELLYFALGYHPDWGYPSVPPVIGWLAGLVRITLGTSVFAVKFLPAVLSGVFVWLIAAIVKEMRGGTFATVLACATAVFMPVSLRTFHLFQPVHLDLIWWTVLTLLLLRYLNTARSRYLLYLGVVVGVALLTKYLVLLWVGGLLLGLLIFRPTIFRERHLYYGAGIALLIWVPNLLWQVTHDWAAVGHLQALSRQQLVNVNRMNILTDQLTMAFAGSLLLVPGLFQLLRRYRVLATAVCFTFAVLLLLRGKSYYAMGTFPALITAGAVLWEKWLGPTGWRYVLPVAMVVLTVPILPLGLPVIGEAALVTYFQDLERDYGIVPGRRWEDGKIHPLPQDYADQLGWTELQQALVAAYAQEPSPETTALYCENYGQAGAALMVKGHQGVPEPISFSDAFNYWVPDSLSEPFTAFYYINDEPASDLDDWFGQVEVVGAIDKPEAREYGTRIYRYSEPLRPFQEFWTARLADDPSPY
ncbi:ArnT family glycosyltransferase [Lewinella sp. IMCC34191]|uniref:ArnT family glycosyltransferase n=1 Tax=Lewinella sp. IMCC34191 TaxID=2259172 RepID=UPI0013008A8E|nr:glycosyltransferase family 39 protein [Lewinella sp. IMCC34191]